jgi:hypothetical protein
MSDIEKIQLFEDQKVRTIWVESDEKWYFSIKDVILILAEAKDPKDYLSKMRRREPELAKGWGQIVHPLVVRTPGGPQKENFANLEGMFRIIQSIPSKKAEPFKRWLAQVGAERIHQMQDPELGIQQSLQDYKRLGYSDNWINQRLKSIEIRKDLTDQWKAHGVEEGTGYATLTDIIYYTWAGLTAREYKHLKGLKQENLRDNMTNEELVMNMLAELTTSNITKEEHPETMSEHARVAERGGSVAKVAKEAFEKQTGKKVVSSMSMKRYIASQQPKLELGTGEAVEIDGQEE